MTAGKRWIGLAEAARWLGPVVRGGGVLAERLAPGSDSALRARALLGAAGRSAGALPRRPPGSQQPTPAGLLAPRPG